jgi:Fe-S-cluster containining protein
MVELLAPNDIDMSGEPDSFVELNVGRRLIVLRHEGNGCRFLSLSGDCSIYDVRPTTCAAYPFTVEREQERAYLNVLSDAPCDRIAAFERVKAPNDETRALEAVERVERELSEYVQVVSEWNMKQRRRRLLRRIPRSLRDFLGHLGLD